MIGLAVIVILNGSIVASAPPARLIAGHVMAPVRVLASFAERSTIGADGNVVAGSGTRTIAVPISYDDAGDAYVPLAEIARALGGSVAYDGRSHSIALRFAPRSNVRTPEPYDPAAPRVAPTTLFTPEPRPATPRPLESGVPRPRRTAIPETPSLSPGD